jgi:hypothetical protein
LNELSDNGVDPRQNSNLEATVADLRAAGVDIASYDCDVREGVEYFHVEYGDGRHRIECFSRHRAPEYPDDRLVKTLTWSFRREWEKRR